MSINHLILICLLLCTAQDSSCVETAQVQFVEFGSNYKVYPYTENKVNHFVYWDGQCVLDKFPIVSSRSVLGLPTCCLSDSTEALTTLQWFRVFTSCNVENNHLRNNVHVTNSAGIDTAFADDHILNIQSVDDYLKRVSDKIVDGLVNAIPVNFVTNATYFIICVFVFILTVFVIVLICYLFKYLIKCLRFLHCKCPQIFSRLPYDRVRLSSFKLKPKVERVVSPIGYDENGPYVSYKNLRIYTQRPTELQEIAPLASAPIYPVLNKETALSVSTFYDSVLPSFVGLITVGENAVGMFSRINYNGIDCFMTAFHVMASHKLAIMKLSKDDLSYEVDGLWPVLAYSSENDLDYIIIEVPSKVFSKLKMKVGKFASNIPMKASISAFGVDGDVVKRTSGFMDIAPQGKFRIRYGASTLPSWSGTPILGRNNVIMGIHTTGGPTYNLGSLLPFAVVKAVKVVETELVKESPAFGSMYDQDIWDEARDNRYQRRLDRFEDEREEEDRIYAQFEDSVHFVDSSDRSYIDKGLSFRGKTFVNKPIVKARHGHVLEPTLRNWAEIVDEFYPLDDMETVQICAHCNYAQKKSRHCKSCGWLFAPLPEKPTVVPNGSMIDYADYQIGLEKFKKEYISAVKDEIVLAQKSALQNLPSLVSDQILKKIDFTAIAIAKGNILNDQYSSSKDFRHDRELIPNLKFDPEIVKELPQAAQKAVKRYPQLLKETTTQSTTVTTDDALLSAKIAQAVQAAIKANSQVPLNSKSPVIGGNIPGQPKKSAVKSDLPIVPSEKPKRKRSRKNGKNSALSVPKPPVTTGPIVAPKPN